MLLFENKCFFITQYKAQAIFSACCGIAYSFTPKIRACHLINVLLNHLSIWSSWVFWLYELALTDISAITADKQNIVCSFALTFALVLARDKQNALMILHGLWSGFLHQNSLINNTSHLLSLKKQSQKTFTCKTLIRLIAKAYPVIGQLLIKM